MRFMLMTHAPRDWRVEDWAPEDFKALTAFMHDLNKELTESGELVGAA